MIAGLNAFEAAVIEKLLHGDHPLLRDLRTQARNARLREREYTGHGIYCNFAVDPSSPILPGRPSFSFGDVDAEIPGLRGGAGFVFFVVDGAIDLLEGYVYDGVWPKQIHSFSLSYSDEPRSLKLLDRDGYRHIDT